MFDGLKKGIARFIIKRRYLRKENDPVPFNNFVRNSKNVLIVFPENPEHVKQSLEVCGYINTPARNISIVISSEFREMVKTSVTNKIFTYTMEQKSFLKLPNSSVLNNICEKPFDLVIDLNQEENVFSAMISAAASAAFKVGFTDRKIEKLFNYQVGCNESNSNYNYKNLLKSLQMF